MVDGHLQLPDEGVTALFNEDDKKLLVEDTKEELEVRATVRSSTYIAILAISQPLIYSGHILSFKVSP